MDFRRFIENDDDLDPMLPQPQSGMEPMLSMDWTGRRVTPGRKGQLPRKIYWTLKPNVFPHLYASTWFERRDARMTRSTTWDKHLNSFVLSHSVKKDVAIDNQTLINEQAALFANWFQNSKILFPPSIAAPVDKLRIHVDTREMRYDSLPEKWRTPENANLPTNEDYLKAMEKYKNIYRVDQTTSYRLYDLIPVG